MTVQELALRGALSYSGITDLDPDANAAPELARGKTAAIIADCAAEINASIQVVCRAAPHLFKVPNSGVIFKAPVTGTLTATENSVTISAFSAYTADMRGCTIRIAGDSYDNEIVSATQLARPYLGTSGSALGANIWFDASPLDSTTKSVVTPLMIPGLGVVHLANSREEFLIGHFDGPGERSCYPSAFPYAANFTKMTGRPVRWMCEERYDSTVANTQLLLRVYPMPNQKYAVVFEKVVKPPIYTADDVDNDDGGEDPGTVIPFAWAESTLLPILKKRWSSHYSFNQPQAVGEIQSQYQEAMANLEDEKPTRGYRRAIYTNA